MIKVEHLAKAFGQKKAVDDVSFELGRGEVLGFLGPNGAGKSTTMRMITGFIAPTAGRVSVCGFDIESQPLAAKSRIGYLPESAPSYADMSVKGFLGWAADLRGLMGDDKKRAIAKAVDLCSLNSVVHQEIDTLSKGFRHRTCLAQAILHDPDVLILDEPTDGLDPNQKFEVRNLIKRMGQSKAIIFSTHILEEVEAACTRAIIIDRGRIVANGTPTELKSRSDKAGTVLVTVRGTGAEGLGDVLKGLEGLAKAEVVNKEDGRMTMRAYPATGAAGGTFVAALAQLVARQNWTVDTLHAEEGRLDDVFRSLTRPDVVSAGVRA